MLILSDRTLGIVAGITSSAVVGGISLVIQRQAHLLPATEISFARGTVGLIGMLPFVWTHLSQLAQRGSSSLWVRAIAGAISVVCFTWNLQHTSVGMANMLFDLSLLLLLAVGYLGGEVRLTSKLVWALIVIVVGCWAYWYGVNPSLSLKVVLTGIFGAVAASVAYTAMKKAVRNMSPILIVWASCAATLPVSFITSFDDWVVPTLAGWVILFLIGLGMLLSQFLLTVSFSRLPLPLASALIPSSIVWSVFVEAVTSGEHATPHAIAGTLLYALGICGLTAESIRKPVKAQTSLAGG